MCTPLFRFAQITDTHLVDDASAAILRVGIRSLNDDPVDFVLFSGDMMDIGSDEQYTLFMQCLHALRMPYRMIPGNHDLANAGDAQRYRETFGALNSTGEIAGVHCLALDTTNTDPNPDNWHGMVEAPAMAWLRETLSLIPAEEPHLLFTHHGLVGRPDDLSRDVANADDVLDLFRGRRLLAGFCGHCHRLLVNRWEGIPFYAAPPLSTAREVVGVPPGFLRVDVLRDRVGVCFEVVGGA